MEKNFEMGLELVPEVAGCHFARAALIDTFDWVFGPSGHSGRRLLFLLLFSFLKTCYD